MEPETARQRENDARHESSTTALPKQVEVGATGTRPDARERWEARLERWDGLPSLWSASGPQELGRRFAQAILFLALSGAGVESRPATEVEVTGADSRTCTAQRTCWPDVLEKAAAIVREYDTGVTLRQLFYRLVAAGVLRNTLVQYRMLSANSAQARRDGWFPDLLDLTRRIHRPLSWKSPTEARQWLFHNYRRDRTEGHRWSVYVGVEKHGIVMQLKQWFWDYGIPVLALGGYASQTFVGEVGADIKEQGRPAVLIYAGDFDPSGEDIDRDFIERVGAFDEVVRIAVNADQVQRYDLPPAPGKKDDPRAKGFIEEHGKLMQVELDALAPDVLRDLYWEAVNRFWDMATYRKVLKREQAERKRLAQEAEA